MQIRSSAIHNPSPDELREMTAAQATVRETEYGNLNVTTEVTARSKLSTFIVADDESQHTGLKAERAEHMASYADLSPDIAAAV